MDGDDDDDFDDDEDDNFDRDDDVVVIISHVLFWRIGQTEVLIQNPNFDSFFLNSLSSSPQSFKKLKQRGKYLEWNVFTNH